MTTTTKIAGEAMTDEQIIEMASRFAHSDGWLNGDGAIAFARALLASKPAGPVQDETADGELIADLIEQNRSLRARLAAHASPSGEDAAEQAAASMGGPVAEVWPVTGAGTLDLQGALGVIIPRASEQADEAVTRLRRALYQIAHWPDDGSACGQEKIKNFAIRILDGDPVEPQYAKEPK